MKSASVLMCALILLLLLSFSAFAAEEAVIRPGESISLKMEAGKTTEVVFIPTVSGEYAFTSLSECDTLSKLYDENMNELYFDDDGGDTSNFYICYSFEKGRKYIFSVWYYGDKINYDMPVFLKNLKTDEVHTHSYTETVIIPPTCNDEGKGSLYCECGYSFEKTYDKLIHNYEVISYKNADCINAGKITEKCTLCSAVTESTISALGHIYSSEFTVDTEPTCTSYGYASRHCIRCNKTTETKTLPKSEHLSDNEYEITKNPTCSTKGEKVKRCSVCNKIIETAYIEQTEHTPSEFSATKEPTCTAKGEKVMRCSVCNKIIETVYIEQTEHTPSEFFTTKEPTCTAKGEKVKRCSICNKILEQETTEKLEHTPSESFEVTKAPTCTAAGEKIIRCTLCNKTLESVKINKLGHTAPERYEIVKQATCTAKGELIKCCTVCSDTVERKASDKLGHSYSESLVTDEKSTLSKAGSKSRHCIRCNSKTDVITVAKIKSVKLSTSLFTYNGKKKTLKITARDSKGAILRKGIDYTISYKKQKDIGSYSAVVTFQGDYEGSQDLKYKIIPETVSTVKGISETDRVKLSWSKVKGDVRYRVYRKIIKTGKYKLLKETDENSYPVKGLKSGTEYEFTIKAVKKVNGKVYKSEKGGSIKISTVPVSVKLKAVSEEKRHIRLSWSKTACDGYEIYKYNESSKKYEPFKKIKNADITYYERSNMKSGKTYKFKIRSYKKNGNKVLYSAFSKEVKIRVVS